MRFDITSAKSSSYDCSTQTAASCPAKQIDQRRAVTDRTAPFSATFADLPWSDGHSDPSYNNKCLDGYVTMTLTATVKTKARKTIKLDQAVSYCPPQHP